MLRRLHGPLWVGPHVSAQPYTAGKVPRLLECSVAAPAAPLHEGPCSPAAFRAHHCDIGQCCWLPPVADLHLVWLRSAGRPQLGEGGRVQQRPGPHRHPRRAVSLAFRPSACTPSPWPGHAPSLWPPLRSSPHLWPAPPRSSSPTGLPAATRIGRNVTIGQSCLLRSTTVEDECVIGDKCVLLEGSLVEKNAGGWAAGALAFPLRRNLQLWAWDCGAGRGSREQPIPNTSQQAAIAWRVQCSSCSRRYLTPCSAGAWQRAAAWTADTLWPAVGRQPSQVCAGPHQGRGGCLLSLLPAAGPPTACLRIPLAAVACRPARILLNPRTHTSMSRLQAAFDSALPPGAPLDACRRQRL